MGLFEDVGSEGGVGQLENVAGPHKVEPGLVLVHRVQDRLEVIVLMLDYSVSSISMSSKTYKAVLVRQVVGELQLVEGDDLLHPLLAGGRAVGVNVHPLGHLRVRLARHHPLTEL